MTTTYPSTTTTPDLSRNSDRSVLSVLKFLQCTNFGGMEQVAYGLLDKLSSEYNCHFRIVTPRPFGPGKERVEAVDSGVRAFPYRGKFGWRTFRSLKSYVTTIAEGADSAWVTGTCACSLASIKNLRCRKVLSHHFHHFERPTSRALWYGFYNLLCRDLDVITYPTDFTRNEAISIAPWIRGKSHVVRYGYFRNYTNERERIQAQQIARRALDLPQDAFIIGNGGWLIPRKRFDVFLQTAQRLAGKSHSAYFVICGGGPLESELKKLAHQLDIADRVRFTGWVPNMSTHYQAWDVCLFNSDFDTLPCASMEPAAHGCLFVGSLLYGGLAEFYQTGKNGILLSQHNADALASHIQALAESPQLAEEFRQAAIEKLKADYSMEKSLRFYRDALTGSI